MSFKVWLENSCEHIREEGLVTGGRAAATEFYRGVALRVFDRLPNPGTPVFERDWDALVVLDAMRTDALQEVAPEYDWLPAQDAIPTVWSNASMSEEWMEMNFHDGHADEMARSAHVTWNAFSNHQLDPDDWVCLDEVWRDTWDDDLGCVPAEAITERAVRAGRAHSHDRIIVHYQQPHAPFRRLAEGGIIETLKHEYVGDKDGQGRLTVWKLLRRGQISHETAWAAYLDNLRWALDEVDRLRRNMDAETMVLTADHGDCWGEWGGLYCHPRGVPAPELMRVPWVEIEAADTGGLTPAQSTPPKRYTRDTNHDDDRALDRLKQLGYL